VISLPERPGIILGDDAAENPCPRTTADRAAGPTTRTGLTGEPETMKTTIRRMARQLSVPVSVLAAALFASGMISGWFAYLGRSPVRERYVPGSSAWWQELAVAAAAGVLFGYAWWRRQRRSGPRSGRLWLLAPLGKPAAQRVARTVRGGVRGRSGLGRVLLAVPPAGLFLYSFYRAGEQVTGGLDPNSTVNAWGGPTYLGAMACHYLDCLLIMAAAAWLLDRILLPVPAQPPVPRVSPARRSASAMAPSPLPPVRPSPGRLPAGEPPPRVPPRLPASPF
jgi:hypothetical protein